MQASNLDLAMHLRALREEYGLTLAVLAQQSGVSRASLSRIENGEVSPTAETLGQMAAAFGLPISHLLSPMQQAFQPLVRQRAQAVWQDPDHGFIRRSISPPNGELAVELIEGQLEANQTIRYEAPAVPGQEHHLYMLSGALSVSVEGRDYALGEGDCLRYQLVGETIFETQDHSCRYVIALL